MLPFGKEVLNDVPSSDVTVWAMPELFCQQTDCPCVMVVWFGENDSELVALTLALAPLEPHEFATEVELEQAAAISARPEIPIPRITRM